MFIAMITKKANTIFYIGFQVSIQTKYDWAGEFLPSLDYK